MIQMITDCKRQLRAKRAQILQELDIKYMTRINELLQQKSMISKQIQQAFDEQFDAIESIISQTALCSIFPTEKKKKSKASSAENAFKCTVCDASFHSNKKLREHQNIHTKQKQFECKHCLKSFVSKIKRDTHSSHCALNRTTKSKKSEDTKQRKSKFIMQHTQITPPKISSRSPAPSKVHLSLPSLDSNCLAWNRSEWAGLDNLYNSLVTIDGYHNHDTTFSLGYCVSQRKWSPKTGKHSFSLKIVNHDEKIDEFSIGLVTKNHVKTSNYLFDDKKCGHSYQFWFDSVETHQDKECTEEQGMYEFNNGRQYLYKSRSGSRIALKKGSFVTMSLDSDKNILSFYVNGETVGKMRKIGPIKYYPAIAFRIKQQNTKYTVTELY